MMPVNPKSLVNLKPFTEGLSGNPLGRPKAIRFRKMLETVLMAEQEVLEGEAKVRVRRLYHLLRLLHDRACELIAKADNIPDLMGIIPLLRMYLDALEGKQEAYRRGPVTATKSEEHRVILIGDRIDHTEKVQTMSKSVELLLPEKGE